MKYKITFKDKRKPIIVEAKTTGEATTEAIKQGMMTKFDCFDVDIIVSEKIAKQ